MNLKTLILLIEDDVIISRFIKNTLENENYKVDLAYTGKEGIQLFQANNPNIVIVDLGLPDLDGVEVVKYIRSESKIPILILSARHESNEKVRALDCGADDYLTKPFSVDEFLARIRVSTRRIVNEGVVDEVIRNGELVIDRGAQRVMVANTEVKLTPNEYKLLVYLALNIDKVITYNSLIKEVWGLGYDNIETLRVYMTGIRKKLEKCDGKHKYIQTHVGVGYRMIRYN